MAKTRKRGLALLMAVVLALSLLPVSALASGEEETTHEALTLAVGDEETLVPSVEEVSGKWYVEEGKGDVVSVDENGVVCALGEGTANVYFEYAVNMPETLEAVPAVVIPETPAVEEPAVEEPTVEEPTVEEPTVEEPTVEEPTVEEPTVEEPTVEEPAVEEPAVEEPTVNEIMPLVSTQYSAGAETKVEVFPIEVVDLSDGKTVLVGDSLRLDSPYFGKAWDQKKVLEVVVKDTSGNELSRKDYDVFSVFGNLIVGSTRCYIDVTVLPQRGYKIVSSEPAMDTENNVRFVYDNLSNYFGSQEKRTLTVTVEKDTATEYNVKFVWNADSLLGGNFSDVVYQEVTVSAQDTCLGADMPADPVYYNQAFEGWNTRRDGKGIEVTADTSITQDMTVYGQWSVADIVREYHVMGLTNIKRVIMDKEELSSFDFAIKSIQATDGRTSSDVSSVTNKYLDEWDCWTVDNHIKPVRPEEITGLVATIEVNGQERQVEIPVSQFASMTRHGYIVEIELEVPAYDEAVVTFWYQPNAGILWEEYTTRTVKVGESLGENMPAEPTYPGSTYQFRSWNTEKELGAEFKADTVVNGDMNVYARKGLRDAGTSQYHVIGDGELYGKVAAAYLKQYPDAAITADDVAISKMSMVGKNGATNKDYWGVVNANEWCDYDGVENYYYYIHNVDALNVGFGSNTRVPVEEIVGLKLWCTVNDQPYEYQVPRANLDLAPKGDAIVEVRVKMDQYTVTFMDGKDVYATQTVSEGSVATRPADPTKTSMEFQGWTLKDGTAFDFQTRIYENVVLYAQWEPAEPGKQTITLRYEANGADVTNLPAPEEQTVEAGQSATFTVTTQEPARKNYTFLGWAENAADKTAKYEGGESLTVDSSKVLYAVWKPVESGKQTITLRYEANGADVTNLPAPEERTVEVGQSATFTVSTQKPARKNYTFLGWAENAADKTAKYEGGESLTVDSSKVLYAVWKDETQTPDGKVELSFRYVTDVHNASKVPNGVAAPETVELDEGSVFGTYGHGTGDYNRHYTFHGWFADADCTEPMEEDTVLTQDTVVYGYWTYSSGGSGGGTGGGDGDGGSTDVPDENVPTTDLPDVNVPTTEVPDEGTDLGDGDVPLAEVPKTGDSSALWVLAAAVSGIGLVWLTVCKKRESEQ